MAPTADHAAADGQHVDRTHRRGRRQSHQECARKHADIRNERHVAAHAARGTSKTTIQIETTVGSRLIYWALYRSTPINAAVSMGRRNSSSKSVCSGL